MVQYSGPNVPNQIIYSTTDPNYSVTLISNEALQQKLDGYNLPTKQFMPLPTEAEPNAYILYPPNMDMSKKYPLLMNVYGGPGSQMVTKTFPLNGFHYYLASQYNVIIAAVDGRGTGNRGWNYIKPIYKNLGEYETIDQVAGAEYFKTLDYVDPDRVAIWGWSYGGYMTLMSISNSSSTFNFGISVAPVTSWTFYDSVYTERFMLTPQLNPAGYETSAPLNYATNIADDQLLLVHGTADDNVHFENSAEEAEILIQEGIQFTTMYYPNSNHAINNGNSRNHLYTLLTNFIIRKFQLSDE